MNALGKILWYCKEKNNRKGKGYYLANNSAFSSGVMTTCSGTSSCSVMLISSSDSKNCSRMYFGAMSTND